MADECLFDVMRDDDGCPVINIRPRQGNGGQFQLPRNAAILVQIFEQPERLWLAQATYLNGLLMICFSPLEKLVSADGRSAPPEIAGVTLEQVNEGVNDAMEDRERAKKSGATT